MIPPVLVVRASLDPAMMEEFVRWYETEHLPHVMEIPGIVKAYRASCRRAGVNWTALYQLRDDECVQQALSSAQADRARQDWERWLPHVQDLSVEVYACLGPRPTFQHWN